MYSAFLTDKTRSHYRPSMRGGEAPYRAVGAIDYPLLTQEKKLTFEYRLSSKFSRFHSNPPLWHDSHWHEFQVEIVLRSVQATGDLYAVDMIEIQQILNGMIENVPDRVNDLEGCESGTTESLCGYFSQVQRWISDPNIELMQVSVSECPERVTTLLIRN